ncbi:hypothetical protein TrST_g10272 [Triparma strigata]|uniref:Uncharacterized protein n=1 Tax=Triparma strigata TaxID=1606541 RepID=A0A9W7A090_9STRA|nr:hypothetical protein TrST_g10272 [Triparma strigata]
MRGGGAGLILGLPLGSSAIGLLVGIAIARYVALEPGHIGAIAREFGWGLERCGALMAVSVWEQMLLSRLPPLSAPSSRRVARQRTHRRQRHHRTDHRRAQSAQITVDAMSQTLNQLNDIIRLEIDYLNATGHRSLR